MRSIMRLLLSPAVTLLLLDVAQAITCGNDPTEIDFKTSVNPNLTMEWKVRAQSMPIHRTERQDTL